MKRKRYSVINTETGKTKYFVYAKNVNEAKNQYAIKHGAKNWATLDPIWKNNTSFYVNPAIQTIGKQLIDNPLATEDTVSRVYSTEPKIDAEFMEEEETEETEDDAIDNEEDAALDPELLESFRLFSTFINRVVSPDTYNKEIEKIDPTILDKLNPTHQYAFLGVIQAISWKLGRKTLRHRFKSNLPLFYDLNDGFLETPGIQINTSGIMN